MWKRGTKLESLALESDWRSESLPSFLEEMGKGKRTSLGESVLFGEKIEDGEEDEERMAEEPSASISITLRLRF